MATIVDALLVTLGLDTKEYEKGTKKAEKELASFDKKRTDSEKREEDAKRKAGKEQDHRFKQQQHQNKEVYEALGKIRNQIVAIGGLFMAGQGILAFAKSSIDTAANVGRLADNTQMATEEIAGLEQAFKRTGGSAEEAGSTVAMLSKELAKASIGQQSNVAEFAHFGGDMQHGALSSTKQYLLSIADLLQKINKENPQRAWLVAGRLGLSDTAFNLLKQGRKAVQAQIADGARLSGMNRKQAQEAQEAQRVWADMASVLASIGKAVLFPILQEIGDWMRAHKKDIEGWLVTLRRFISNITPQAISKVKEEFVQIGDAIKNIADALVKLRPLMDDLGLTAPKESKDHGLLYKGAQGIWNHRDLLNPVGMMGGAFDAFKMLLGGKSSSDTNVNISQITVNTKATDAHGVAASIGGALRQQKLAIQANSGAR